MRVTIICPALLCAQANQLALVLGQSMADGQTFEAREWTGMGAGVWALACVSDGQAWMDAAASLPMRPDWDAGQDIDMVAAETARQALSEWSGLGDMPGPDPRILLVTQVDPAQLVARFATGAMA